MGPTGSLELALWEMPLVISRSWCLVESRTRQDLPSGGGSAANRVLVAISPVRIYTEDVRVTPTPQWGGVTYFFDGSQEDPRMEGSDPRLSDSSFERCDGMGYRRSFIGHSVSSGSDLVLGDYQWSQQVGSEFMEAVAAVHRCPAVLHWKPLRRAQIFAVSPRDVRAHLTCRADR
jgi:hypothetical protein